MHQFNENIIRKYGSSAQLWLNFLPQIVNNFIHRWGITDAKTCADLKYHYVISGIYAGKPVVAKFELDDDTFHYGYTGYPIKPIDSVSYEIMGLEVFRGFGAVLYIGGKAMRL